ncbi:MAG: hypothetical protein J4G19_01655 [Pseudomonadales bacterium]|nr:hypothetical protein [Pseudomonadales bacterium]
MPSPSGSSLPQLPSIPSPGSPSMPTALPSQSGSNTPSLPSPASSGSSQQQSSGADLPSIPGLPQRSDRERSQGSQADSGRGEQSQGAQDGELGQLPSGGPLQTADDGDQNSRENQTGEGGVAEQNSGDESKSASSVGVETGTDVAGLPSSGAGEEPEGGQEIEIDGDDPGAGVLGTPDAEENGGWVVSNELPETEKVRQGVPEPSDEGGAEEDAKSEADKALEETLADIDGSIMSDREEHAEKINEQAGGEALPGDAVLADADQGDPGGQQRSAAGGTSREHIPNVNHPDRRSQPPDPDRAGIRIGEADMPDAKDDDVVARQLREAALAEKDPELRAALWDELRRYLEKRK